jgi:hypothetical protein
VFHRSSCRPVKIRVEAESPRSAVRIASPLPAGTSLMISRFISIRQPASPPRPRLRVIRLSAASQPDWRIVGEQDAEFAQEGEGLSL